jgi:hypothetical protein
MRILFCEGSSLSARETLTALAGAGHRIVICDPNPRCLCRFSSLNIKYYRCTSINDDVDTYYRELAGIIKKERIDVLLPVHEEALLFSKRLEDLSAIVHVALPAFDDYCQLFSKINFMKLLDGLVVPHPLTLICKTTDDVRKSVFYPCFLKTDYGTASTGVWNLRDEGDLDRVLSGLEDDGNGLLIQEPARGVMEIAYALFDSGTLVSFHACRRMREGMNGSSSGKIGVNRPRVVEHFRLIGRALSWHGALAVDYFWDDEADAPSYIDASPRLVEPMNAAMNGINMAEGLVELSMGRGSSLPLVPSKGERTHMLMMAILLIAAKGGTRHEILAEIEKARMGEGPYRGSVEELNNDDLDRGSHIPLVVIAARLFLNPKSAAKISVSTVKNYALDYATIRRIIEG